MNKHILYQPWGGLGDNLQYSTLPELYYSKGEEFYLSDQNVYRNQEIYKLVWELNPFVKGITNEPYNIGSCKDYQRVNATKSIVFNQEIAHSFTPLNEIPKIFYKPKNILDFNDKIFIDISATSTNPTIPNNFSEIIQSSFSNFEVFVPEFTTSLSNNHKINKNFSFDLSIKIESIFHFCDLIHSCKYFICSFSGQSVLASALNKKDTLCFLFKHWENSDYKFPNINYHLI